MHIGEKEKSTARLKSGKRLLGRILVDGEFVTTEQLRQALEQQKGVNRQLGEILTGMGVLRPADLNAVLSIQQELSTLKGAIRVGAGEGLLLGELLVRAKRITIEQLDYALREQHRTSEKLGEVLVRLGLLMEHELDVVLAFQKHQVGESEGAQKLRLGEILVATGQITRQQLEEALKKQKISNQKIGELLVERGYLEPDQVEHSLKLQQKLVSAALVALLSLANGEVTGDVLGATTAATATINISAVVRERTNMQVLNQVNELLITSADISRGYVEVPAASRIRVKTNNRAGCLLAFEMVPDPGFLFGTVSVNVGGRELLLPSGSGWVRQPYAEDGMIQNISYRFALPRNAQPGTYTWPLSISVLPLGQ